MNDLMSEHLKKTFQEHTVASVDSDGMTQVELVNELGRRLITSAEEAMDDLLQANLEEWRRDNPEWSYVPARPSWIRTKLLRLKWKIHDRLFDCDQW